MGKRTYTLKELAQRDFAALPKAKDTAPKFNLVNIQEDLLDGQESMPVGSSPLEAQNSPEKGQQSPPTNDQNLALPNKLVD